VVQPIFDRADGIVLGKMQKRNGAGVENRLHGVDVRAGSVPRVQLPSTLSMGFDSAARWISTGSGWSSAPAVKRPVTH
jgi:hypothetical protein